MATFLLTFSGNFWLRKNLATFWATFSGSFWLSKNLATFWATFDKNLAIFSQHFLAALLLRQGAPVPRCSHSEYNINFNK